MSADNPSRGHDVVINRERDLAEMFVRLADTLVDDYDVVDVLGQLVDGCVRILGVTAAGLLLDDQRGHLALVACSSEETRLLEVFQLQNNEGPCLDCVRSRSIVTSSDLSRERDRWPVFAPEALSSGFHSVTAVPLRLRRETIGGLNLFSDQPVELPPLDRQLAQALADVATIAILQQRAAHRTSLLAEQLQAALNSRVTIEQAKGVLAERNEISMTAAFAVLRKHARDANLKLSFVAEEVVRGRILPISSQGDPS